jgi:hypothetical protein
VISQEAAQKILGIKQSVHLSPQNMARELRVTLFPYHSQATETVLDFGKKMEESLKRLGVEIVPYNDALEKVTLSKRLNRFLKYNYNNSHWLFRKLLRLPEINLFIPFTTIFSLCGSRRIRKDICIICLGEQKERGMAMQYITSFKTNSVVTIIDFPKNITSASKFDDHFNTAMSLFSYHMTNIVIAVDDKKWMLYNFNASHPIYDLDDRFDEILLKSLIPKIAAPITPHKFKEFKIVSAKFNAEADMYQRIIKQMREGAVLLDDAHIYPPGKKIDDLPFRNNFHRLIGKMHLDNRNGMSFGYIAFQMPVENTEVIKLENFKQKYPNSFVDSDFYIDSNKNIYILLNIKDSELVVKVPGVWVMTLRSGSNKTHFDTERDLLKLGLVNGEMYMEFPNKSVIDNNYKPSFDTKVILAHAVGNAIISSVSHYMSNQNSYSQALKNTGMAIIHWHGYMNIKKKLPGLVVYGRDNPHVSCSSPQSALFALMGKIENFISETNAHGPDYVGDIHVEPHHGVNVSYPSLTGLAKYILSDPEVTELGNKYL